jgi:hypothetical protein
LRNLADRFVPEKLPALQLTSAPVNPWLASNVLVLPQWSSLIEGPKIYYSDKPRPPLILAPPPPRIVPPASATAEEPVNSTPMEAHKLRLHLSRSRLREAVLIAIAILEAGYLLISYVALH